MPTRRSGRHRARHSHGRARQERGQARPVLGLIATAVVVAALAFVATTTAARSLLTSGTAIVADPSCPVGSSASAAACPAAAPAASSGAAAAGLAQPAAASSSASGHPPSGTPSRSRDGATATGGPATAAAGSAVEQVLRLVNNARAQAGLPGYTITADLTRSSGRHNALMAAGCGLSHQCPGEHSLGARETAVGIPWTSAGENIGEGGPVAGTPAAIAQMAVELTSDMLNERPPDDGHRVNILSRAYRHIGIAVTRDSHGTVWLTQDFSN